MSSIKFESKWVEKCVRAALNKQEGELDSEDISKIQYAKAGGDFSGAVVLELSVEKPPEPFAAFDGGDEWAISLYSETTLGEKYKLDEYVRMDGSLWLNHFEMEEWEYAFSQKAEAEWRAFEKTILKNNIYEDYTEEELNTMEWEFLPMKDLSLLSGLKVLRLYEAEVDSLSWFESFPNLKVLELAEVASREQGEDVNIFSGLQQISFWID